MAVRRSSSIHPARHFARELSLPTKTVELEIRVARLEVLMQDFKESLSALSKRTLALQAQLDHLTAKLGHR